MEYSGYLDGEFLNTSELFNALGHAINSAETMARTRISEVFVGVPGEFTTVIVKEPTLTFPNKRKITGIEIEQLFNVGDNFQNNEEFLLINRSPIYFTLDDGRIMIDARDSKTSKLSGQLSYVLAKKKFTNLIGELLKQYDIKKIEYISTSLAESLYLIDTTERDRFAVLVDIGYTTSSVMLMRGDGLLYLKSFAVGGGHITADLYEYFKIPFPVAEELKKKVSLTFAVSSNEAYEIETKTQKYTFPCAEAHKVVEARLDIIAKLISKCMSLCAIEYPSYINYKLTGGGVSYMRGAKEYLGKKLNKNLE
ncbi:MAG: cell division FtsA domain-containing protein, partial [Clostridia bacterium]